MIINNNKMSQLNCQVNSNKNNIILYECKENEMNNFFPTIIA